MISGAIVELDRVDSTNLYANRLLDKGEMNDGTVIWALEQHAGRGQNENVWYSDPGKNLTFTVVLYPRILGANQQFRLNKSISLGVLDFIKARLSMIPSGIPRPAASIKWPNDIYIGDRKVAGILIENRIMGPQLDTSIVGIGININQEYFLPEAKNAVSLIHFNRHEIDLKQALSAVCRSLETRYGQLFSDYGKRLDEDYCSGLLGYRSNRKFLVNSEPFDGQITGVDDLGHLLIKKPSGETVVFNHKEIEYLF